MNVLADDRDLLRRIEGAFASVMRPPHFTDFAHCAECAEHDRLLRVCADRVMVLEDVGYAGWDPFCVALPTSFAFFFPSLARFALADPDAEHGWYGTQLLFHLDEARRANGFHASCTTPQRAAVAALLKHLMETRRPLIDGERAARAFVDCYRFWVEPAALN